MVFIFFPEYGRSNILAARDRKYANSNRIRLLLKMEKSIFLANCFLKKAKTLHGGVYTTV
jgi:hypothetical protein